MLAVLLAGALGVTGCATQAEPRADREAELQRELAGERERHREELDAATKRGEIAREEATARGREVERLGRELQAARAASATHKEGLDAALAMLGAKEQELRAKRASIGRPLREC